MNKTLLLFTTTILTSFTLLLAGNFTSIQDGPWNDPATWSPTGVPDITATSIWPGDNVVINHAVNYTGDLTTAKQSSVDISGGGHLMISGKLSISNTSPSSFALASSGTLTTGELLINTSVTAINLDGTLVTGKFDYTASVDIQIGGQITVNGNFNTSGGSTINFTGGQFTVTGNSTTTQGVLITVDGGAELDFGDLNLMGDADIRGVNSGGSLSYNTISMNNSSTVIQCINNACLYDGSGNTGTPPTPLSLLTGAQILPVELMSYSVKENNGIISLFWQSSQEENNDYFLIEHSTDGLHFAIIAKRNGQGDSYETHNYAYQHMQPKLGDNYYRLSQVDFDGSKSNLGLKVVAINQLAVSAATIYPNPAYGGQKISIPLLAETETAQVNLINSIGQQQLIVLVNENKQWRLPENIVPGFYFIQIKQGSNQQTLPLVIQ